jgi:hypothetical protein
MHRLETLFTCYNLNDNHAKESFCLGVMKWSSIIGDTITPLPDETVICDFGKILDQAWRKTRIRCQLTDALAKSATLGTPEENTAWCQTVKTIVCTIGTVIMTGVAGAKMEHIRMMAAQCRGGGQHLIILRSQEPYAPDPEDRFGWRDFPNSKGMPMVICDLYKHIHAASSSENKEPAHVVKLVQENRNQRIRTSLLSGQVAAFDGLRLMLKARRERLTAGGIKPRLHGLVIGPSGSGKTHVVRAVAECENLPIYEQSAGSWMPQGAKAELSSARRIAQFVEANETGIIYIDEVEKPFPSDLSKTVPWERYCTDECMSLLDAKVAQWEGWSVPLTEKLDRSFFIIMSGAWQAAYSAAFKNHQILGGDWTNLSIADSFMDDNHLPTELLNRVSTNIIEVLPPSVEELAEMIERVQYDLGVMVDQTEAQRIAKEIAQERKGVRAVEEFLLKRWMRQQGEVEGIR